jgi:hypothetical protein
MVDKTTLEAWVENGWIRRHPVDKTEISKMLETAEQDLEDSATSGLSQGWRFNIAYSAILTMAGAALAACGYRAERETYHYWSIQSLSLTVGLEATVVDQLDSYRKKRHTATYEEIRQVSEKEADEIFLVASGLWERLLQWLKQECGSL